MNRLVYLLLICVPVIINAQEPDSTSALYGMLEAERNFARESVSYGRNAAFIKNMAEESVIYTDRWITSGLKYFKERESAPYVLKWEPEYMDIAVSGDLGVSTGPWEMQEYRPNTVPVATGYFLTVWKKDIKGRWKAILDAGTSAPAVSGTPHLLSFPPDAGMITGNFSGDFSGKAASEINDTEKMILGKWIMTPVATTYMTFLSNSIRMLTNGNQPSTDADVIITWITQGGSSLVWKTAGSGASRSGDLGYTYGYFQHAGKPGINTGHYVRIWKKQPDGTWLITMEMRSFEQ